MERWRQDAEAVEAMMKSDGWYVFQRHLESMEENAMRMVELSLDGNLLVRNIGELKVLRHLADWAGTYVQRYKNEVAAQREKARRQGNER